MKIKLSETGRRPAGFTGFKWGASLLNAGENKLYARIGDSEVVMGVVDMFEVPRIREITVEWDRFHRAQRKRHTRPYGSPGRRPVWGT